MKVLIVDDQAENQKAAKEFFKSQGIEVEVVANLEAATEKLREGPFVAGIFDVMIPRTEGEKPERLGPEVGKVANEMSASYVYLTGGYHHHETPIAKVFSDEFCLERDIGKTVADKSEPIAWGAAWATIKSWGHLEEIWAAQQRRWKYRRKP